MNEITRRWVAVGLYGLSLVISIIFLPESIPSVIEKNRLMATFELVEQQSRSYRIELISRPVERSFSSGLWYMNHGIADG